jgi:hypothetical protein
MLTMTVIYVAAGHFYDGLGCLNVSIIVFSFGIIIETHGKILEQMMHYYQI